MSELKNRTVYSFRHYLYNDLCIGEHLEQVSREFKSLLFSMYFDEELRKVPHEMTPHRYDLIVDKGTDIAWNPKQELFTIFMPCTEIGDICEDPSNTCFLWGHSKDEVSDSKWQLIQNKFHKDVRNLFGPGEFPHLTFYVIELPDRPYCFYRIHR